MSKGISETLWRAILNGCDLFQWLRHKQVSGRILGYFLGCHDRLYLPCRLPAWTAPSVNLSLLLAFGLHSICSLPWTSLSYHPPFTINPWVWSACVCVCLDLVLKWPQTIKATVISLCSNIRAHKQKRWTISLFFCFFFISLDLKVMFCCF